MARLTVSRRALDGVLIAIVLCSVVALSLVWYRGRSDSDEAEVRQLRQQYQTPSSEQTGGHTTIDLAAARNPRLDRQLAQLDAKQTVWTSEAVSETVTAKLKKLGHDLETEGQGDLELDAFTTPSFQGERLESSQLTSVYHSDLYDVKRWRRDVAVAAKTIASFQDQLASFLGGSDSSTLRCAFKVTHIEVDEQSATTLVRTETLRRAGDRLVETTSHGRCRWRMIDDDVKLDQWTILDFEQVDFAADGRPLFEDVTASAFAPASASPSQRHEFKEHVLRDLGHWSERLWAVDDMSIYGHHGVAVADVNLDGLEDLYVCDSGGLPNRLYLQQGDGTIRDASADWKVDWLESTSSALLTDLDNDGDPDLVAATVAGLIIASNEQPSAFRIRSAIPDTPEVQSMCAADYDNDGDLDLYVTVYGAGGAIQGERGSEASPPVPYNDANNGGRNLLLENRGNFQFRDVTEATGLDANNRRFSFAASWEDFDNDGDMDLYVANDFGRNNLYRNEKGRFRDVAAETNTEDMAGGMSVSWGDCNEDGRMDLYVGNMFSAAGNRVTYQRRFLGTRSAAESAGIQRMARGNTLFVAQPDGTFVDASETAGVTMGRWAWSSKFADLNNDGREDLLVANGYFTNRKPDDL